MVDMGQAESSLYFTKSCNMLKPWTVRLNQAAKHLGFNNHWEIELQSELEKKMIVLAKDTNNPDNFRK